ncbi:MAG: K(+)-transporting ATPase subunit F [Candidatus Acidiferrales bacterium]
MAGNIVLLVVCVLILVYLLAALLWPERF